MDIQSHQNLLNLDNDMLKSLCRKLGLPKGNRLEMVGRIEGLVVTKKRKRRQETKSRSPVSPPLKRRRTVVDPNQLRQQLVRFNATVTIQRFWRENRFYYTNDTDFITLEPIEVPPYRLVEDAKNVYRFHPMSLANYFLKEGKFINPYTRRALYPVELRRLDRMVRQYDKNFISLYDEHQKLAIQRAQEREHERTCHLLHQESLRLLNDILTLTQDEHLHMPSIMFELVNVILPRYFHTFRQLYMLDYSFACDSILFICHSLKRMWEDPEVASTRERCHIIETTEYSIVRFCNQLLPIFGVLLPEFTGVNLRNGDEEEEDVLVR